MAWGKRLGASTALLLVTSVAGAEPAGPNAFVPVAVEGTTADSVVVETGDHLWKISQAHLDRRLGRPSRAEEVTPYWHSVIEENRDHLLSGDPDLIYPGEIVRLPPPGPGPEG